MPTTQKQPPAAGEAAHTPALPIGIYSPSNAPEHVRIIDGKHFTLFDSQNADIWPMSPEVRAFIVRACNSQAAMVAALSSCLQQLEYIAAESPEAMNHPDLIAARAALNAAKGTA